MSIKEEKLIIIDGACGTTIQQMGLPKEVWGDRYAGCNEYLNLSAGQAIVEMHSAFLNVGATVVETNTFGATRVVLAEYGLEDQVDTLNRRAVEHAKQAVDGKPGRYVAGSIGPTTKLPSLGQIDVSELRQAYLEQIRPLVDSGVDLLCIETCQDLLQAKTAAVAAFDILEQTGKEIPVIVSVTIEPTGTMLVGTPLSAVVATFEPFPLFALGLNCATGPEKMKPHVTYLAEHWPGRISVVPNAGMPEIVDGDVSYPLSPEGFAAAQRAFVEQNGVSVVGGCCGTTVDHIKALVAAVDGVSPKTNRPSYIPSLASMYAPAEIPQEIPPLLVGERMNANGSRKFKKLLLKEDYDKAVGVGQKQVAKGAHVLDLCVAYAGRDEKTDFSEMLKRLVTTVKLPLMIDSTTPEAIESALSQCPGRPVVNSINLEDGGKTLAKVAGFVKRYGAAVVALPIGPDGMAMTADDKLALSKQILQIGTEEYGLRPSDFFFDMLTFTIGSGDPNLKESANETLAAISRVKKELPGVFTVLGVSNISFGLPKAARKVVNSVFLARAIDAGLDAAIVDAGSIRPLAAIPEEERKICLDLILNRPTGDDNEPLDVLINYFEQHADTGDQSEVEGEQAAVEKQLENKLQAGDANGIEDLLSILSQRYQALDIINEILIPGMRRVGELFGRGEMLLPFVLKSAEVMKKSVDYLTPLMAKVESGSRTKVLLATVQGDVHDIGKNLVDIILSNNGYEVFNIGTNISTEKIIEEAKEHQVDAIGLSGLLVKSAMVMQHSMPTFSEAQLGVPILLGGAALTPKFVAEACVPGYPHPVVYCPDAFSGLAAVQQLEQGKLVSTEYKPRPKGASSAPAPRTVTVTRNNPTPQVPFKGVRHVTDVNVDTLLPYLNKQALFRGRWGYRRGSLSADEYRELIEQKVEPIYEQLSRQMAHEGLATPKVAYGYFDCYGEEDAVWVADGDQQYRFDFPRREIEPRLCIADFFKDQQSGGDIAGFFVVTLGDRVAERTAELYGGDEYHDYLMMHGFAVELTDALAEYWHGVMRREMGISGSEPTETAGYVTQKYQGSRYGFGYPACPSLDAHKAVFELLKPETIGVSLTEQMQMVPEISTSAIIAHHPQAKYFAV